MILTIREVINAVDPMERIRRCPLGLKSHTQLCPLHEGIDDAMAQIEATFAGLKVADILSPEADSIPMTEGAGPCPGLSACPGPGGESGQE